MLENVNVKAIINSIWLGMFIGLLIQVFSDNLSQPLTLVVGIVAGGFVGFLIGAVTEIITAILPITLAKSTVYFMINSLIALSVTMIIMGFIALATGISLSDVKYGSILTIVLTIVALANIADWLLYMRCNRILKRYKDSFHK